MIDDNFLAIFNAFVDKLAQAPADSKMARIASGIVQRTNADEPFEVIELHEAFPDFAFLAATRGETCEALVWVAVKPNGDFIAHNSEDRSEDPVIIGIQHHIDGIIRHSFYESMAEFEPMEQAVILFSSVPAAIHRQVMILCRANAYRSWLWGQAERLAVAYLSCMAASPKQTLPDMSFLIDPGCPSCGDGTEQLCQPCSGINSLLRTNRSALLHLFSLLYASVRSKDIAAQILSLGNFVDGDRPGTSTDE